jgi:conjugative transfer region protein TrbK
VARADARWTTSVAGFQDALTVQAGVVGGLETSRREMQSLVSASQGASGALQAAQAGNQLLALQAQQLSALTAVVVANGRAQALEAADRAAARADAKARFSSFMGALAPAMTRSLAWGTALIILLGAAVLAGRKSQAPGPAKRRVARRVDADLARCRTAGQGDRACQAAWAAARDRFFGRPAS